MTDVSSYYKMPPVGITKTRGRIGELVVQNYTVRCGHPGCWFVGNSATEPDAQVLLDSHTCPTPPARNELPTGLSTLEKMWDELDAAMVAVNEQGYIRLGSRTLDHTSLQGYVLGICFTLSMMTHPHFRTVDDVLKEGQRRYKMRKGTIPYAPTPTYRNNPPPGPSKPPAGERAPYHGETKAATARTPGRAKPASKQQTPASRVDLSSVDQDKRKRIIKAVTMMGMSHEEVAVLFSVTPESVKVLVDSTPS